MGKNNKNPKHSVAVNTDKTPKTAKIPQSPQKLLWSFSMLDVEGPFGWHQCQPHDKYFEILKWKKNLETMTRDEFIKTGSHQIPSYRLSKEARDRLVELKYDDFEVLFSLRLTGRNRVWCIPDDNIMRVLWWDPDHLVYPVEKKHT